MNTTANSVIVPERISGLYDSFGVDFVAVDGDIADPIEWVEATGPTILDREIDEDGEVLDAGRWDIIEADAMIESRGFRRIGNWTSTDDGTETLTAMIERA